MATKFNLELFFNSLFFIDNKIYSLDYIDSDGNKIFYCYNNGEKKYRYSGRESKDNDKIFKLANVKFIIENIDQFNYLYNLLDSFNSFGYELSEKIIIKPLYTTLSLKNILLKNKYLSCSYFYSGDSIDLYETYLEDNKDLSEYIAYNKEIDFCVKFIKLEN